MFEGNCGGIVTTSDVTVFHSTTANPSSTVVNTLYVVDLPYTVAWASSELDLFMPASLPLIISSEAKARATSGVYSLLPSTSAAGSLGHSSKPSSDLSVGAQAGIGVAATVLGVLIGALIMYLFVRRRQRRSQSKLAELEGKPAEDDDPPKFPELDGREQSIEVPTKEKPGEMLGDVGHELPQDWAAQEADNDDMRHELDAGYRGEELDDIATPVDEVPRKDSKEKLASG